MPIGSLIAAGSSLLGGLLGKSSADKAREASERMAAQNIQLQKDFAQSGIQWRVEDARKAGVHPLFALGAQTHSFSPVSIDGGADMSMANAVSNMGQDIGRAVNAARSSPERAVALEAARLSLEGAKLDNDIKRMSLASGVQRMQQAASPPMPTSRSVVLPGNVRVFTDPAEATQDQISQEYGDEGLPQIPGQYRFVRDYIASIPIGDWWRSVIETENRAIQNAVKRARSVGPGSFGIR